jgi:hypothetical protein
MKPHVRAAMAAVALSHATGCKISSVYSYSDGGYQNIDASVQGVNVSAFDYSNRCHIDGSLPNLYHHGERAHLELKPSDNKYDGYDYGSSSFFEITVNRNNAELYDYGAGGWFSFST